MPTFLVLAGVFIVNIIFGYWRSNTRKLSVQWVLAIHVPVPIAIGLRLAFLGWNWLMLPVFVLDFAAGQYTGGVMRKIFKKKNAQLSSFLFKDIAGVMKARRKSTGLSPMDS